MIRKNEDRKAVNKAFNDLAKTKDKTFKAEVENAKRIYDKSEKLGDIPVQAEE